jgi:membrane protease YdiL (CAAX protease family)
MSRKLAIKIIIVYFLNLFLLAPIVSAFIYSQTGSEQSALAANLIAYSGVLIYMLVISRKYITQCLKRFNLSYIKYPILGYIFYYGITTIIMSIATFMSGNSVPVSENQLAVEQMVANYDVVIMFLMVVVIAPIMEELVFRSGIIYAVQGRNVERKKYLIILSYAISIILFSFLHTSTEIRYMDDFKEVIIITIPYIILSSVLLYNFVKTKYNVITSILFHMLNNFISFVLLLYFV